MDTVPAAPDPTAPVEVFRTPRAKRARERELVLRAMDIDCLVLDARGETVLAVHAEDAGRAREQIELYERENRGWPRPEQLPEVLSEGGAGVGIWCVLLFSLFMMERDNAFGLDWWHSGMIDSDAVRSGEWWRVVTSLTLHADMVHLAGNLVFGALFVGIVCQLLGTGLALSSVLAAGAVGNALNVLVQGPGFTAIGASTAVFAAIGILGGNRWKRRKQSRQGLAGSMVPLLAAVFLLAYLGMGSGDGMANAERGRVDILGHVAGFLMGLIVGVLHAKFETRPGPRAQQALTVATLGVWALCWWLAHAA